jgi:hypothetical protein
MARIITKVFADIIRVYDTETRLAYELDGTEWSAGLTASALTINSFGKQIGVIYTDQALNLGNSIFGYTVPANVPVALYNQSPGTSSSSSAPSNGGGTTQVTTIGQFLATPNKQPGAKAFLRLIADGVPANTPTFPGYKVLLSNWNNGNGIANYVTFDYDGVDHYVSITSEIGAIATDTIAPARVGLPTLNTNRDTITIAYNEPITGTVVPANFTATGMTVSAATITGQNVVLTLSPIPAAGTALTLAYTAQTIRDGANNPAATYTAVTVDNPAVAAGPLFSARAATLTESNGVYTGSPAQWSNVGRTDTAAFDGVKTLSVKFGGASAGMVWVDATGDLNDYTTGDYGIFKFNLSNYRTIINGALAVIPVIVPVADSEVRLVRSAANNLKAEYSHDAGVTWTLLWDFGTIAATPLFGKIASNTAPISKASLV